MQIVPESITSLWNDWELRVLVLLSLLWQVILIILGNMRKYSKGATISALVWTTYLTADWLATVSLGNLANGQKDSDRSKSNIESKDQMLQAIWAPFLLLHLGGPDTITAYSLEDNSLWLRHLLGLLVQVSVAFYIFLKSWGNNPLTFVAIPVFVSGIIKYSERTYALRAASPDQFEDSLLSSALTLQALDLKDVNQAGTHDHLECVHKGYFLFGLLKHLYADLSLTFVEGRQSCSLLLGEGSNEQKFGKGAFKLVEVQLGFLFDVLYTKAYIIYKWQGLVLRLVSVLSIVAGLVAFHIVIDDTYSRVDVVITYFLFAGAVSLEIYAFASLMLSDWTLQWLTKRKNDRFTTCVGRCITLCRPILCREKRWSGYIGQLNLVELCLKKKGLILTNLLSSISFEFNLLRKRRWKNVVDDDHDELKSEILKVLEKKYKDYKNSEFDGEKLKQLLSHKGNNVVEEKFYDSIGWSFEVEFDHSILLWHVATDICYHSYSGDDKIANAKCKASKKLSDYLFYILLMRPLMLPKWIDRITHVRDTFNHAIKLFHRKKFPVNTSEEACNMLIQLHAQSQVLDVIRSERSGKSVLLDACRLALQLQNNLGNKLWETICEVWIEMLTYAASHGEWGSHAQQLRNGGELLTHVGLLMADLGLSEHFVLGTKGTPVDNQNKGWGWARTKLASPDARPLVSPDARPLASYGGTSQLG